MHVSMLLFYLRGFVSTIADGTSVHICPPGFRKRSSMLYRAETPSMMFDFDAQCSSSLQGGEK